MPNDAPGEAVEPAPRRRNWGALRHRDFRRFWLARVISVAGDNLSLLALPSAAILALSATAAEVGALRAVGFVAYPLLALVAGVWVDRLRRRRIMVVADIGRALALASVPVGFAVGHLTLVQLFIVVGLVGALTVLFDLASTSHVPVLVPREDWASANAQLEMAQQAVATAGPGVAGFLISAVTAPLAIGFDAMSYLVSAALLRSTADPVMSKTSRRHAVAEAFDGFQFLMRHRALRRITVTATISNVGLLAGLAVQLLFLYRVMNLPAYAIGLAFGLGSVASFLGAAANQSIMGRLGIRRALLVATFVEGIGWLLVPAGIFLPIIPALAAAVAISGFFNVTWNVGVTTFRQQQIPLEMMGRVSAAARTIGYGALPVGSILGGLAGQLLTAALGQRLGLAATLTAAALVAASSALALLSSKGFDRS